MRKIKTHFSKWFLPVLFIGYYCCISLCAHVHLENGVVIVHSHFSPKDKGQIPHQHHSLEEIIFFHTLSTVQATDGAVQTFALEQFTYPYFTIVATKESPDLSCPTFGAAAPRAPPAFFV